MSTIIKKEDFQLAPKDDFAFESYTTIKNDILIIVRKDCFNDAGIKYAEFVLNKYLENKEAVISHMLKDRLLSFYENKFTEDYIRKNLGEPQIQVIDQDYATLTWLNHNLDEHIIEVEVYKDFDLSSTLIDG